MLGDSPWAVHLGLLALLLFGSRAVPLNPLAIHLNSFTLPLSSLRLPHLCATFLVLHALATCLCATFLVPHNLATFLSMTFLVPHALATCSNATPLATCTLSCVLGNTMATDVGQKGLVGFSACGPIRLYNNHWMYVAQINSPPLIVCKF
eukprot:superscaffoldBa00000070_g1109